MWHIAWKAQSDARFVGSRQKLLRVWQIAREMQHSCGGLIAVNPADLLR